MDSVVYGAGKLAGAPNPGRPQRGGPAARRWPGNGE